MSTTSTPLLNNLPEEIIDKIISFLEHQPSLANTTLTSRKLNRIATPHLYTAVSLTVSRPANLAPIPLKAYRNVSEETVRSLPHTAFDVPTTDGCNVLAFIKVMKCRPELARHVRRVKFLRQIRNLGFYDSKSLKEFVKDLPDGARFSPLIDSVRTMHLTELGCDLVRSVLRMLPRVQAIDTSGYDTDRHV